MNHKYNLSILLGLLVLNSLPLPAEPRVDCFVCRGHAIYRLTGTQKPLKLASPGFQPTHQQTRTVVLKIPQEGLPALLWEVGTEAHQTPPIKPQKKESTQK